MSPRRKFSTLHASERPINASEVARAVELHRGTAFNFLRTLHAAGVLGHDEATRTYAVSLHILELAYGVLRHGGLIDNARPLMHAVSDGYGVSVYLSKLLWPSSLLLLDWVGGGATSDPHVTVGLQNRSSSGAAGVVIAAFGCNGERITGTDHVIAASEGLLFIEVDSWMTRINRDVRGKHVCGIMRYCGSHPAFRAHCEAVVADGYREFGSGLGATGQRRESAMDVGMMMVFIFPRHAVRSFGARPETVSEGAQSAICCQGPGCRRRMKRAPIKKMAPVSAS